uniref:Phosphorylated adapter RNA export protein n=1 Tax=Elaeophora elaphi TaxID=1147741 RepID=A0A0R3S2D0_9BILA
MKSIDDIGQIDQERPMAEHMLKIRTGQTEALPKQPMNRFAPTPFIIARDKMQKEIFGLGYPSIPTMTVSEWYDDMVKNGRFGAMNPGSSESNVDSNDVDKGTREEQERARLQRWDEYKDYHRRGWGNMHNKGATLETGTIFQSSLNVLQNMYRVNNSYDQSSSDDEGPSLCKEQKLDSANDTMKNCRAGSKAAQMWTDLLAEQSLSETFSDKVGVHRGENDMVERGVESYVLPDGRYTNDGQEMTYQKNHAVSPAADDSGPFDFIADEENVRKFSDRYGICPRTYDSVSRDRSKQEGPVSSIDREKNIRKSWKHSASTSRSTSRGSGKRRRNSYDPNKGSGNLAIKNARNINNSLKRRRNGRNPGSFASDNYSLEALLATEFPENISIGELAERIVTALGERNGHVILEVGEEKALELFEATRGIEASGGMMIADGTRRRTPGGVFMTLFKTDPDILPVLKEKVCNLQKAAAREIRTAKRRGKREASKTCDIALRKAEVLKKSTASEGYLKSGQ